MGTHKTIKEGGKIENPLLNEIKLFHPSEFIAAMKHY
jgi:transcriptional antiterminator